jgi:peptidoglycan/xylan/chitin deacetylase (PgdA/CDA1 family)
VLSTQHKPNIYLTFDDGPHPAFTPRILDILHSRKIKATFFVVGSKLKAKTLADVVVAAASDGHTIGNHTFTHPDLTACSEEQIRREIENTGSQLHSLGIHSRLLRPPYGSTNDRVAEVVHRLGYELTLWDNDPRDWKSDCQSESQWVTNAISAVDERNAGVIVCHDIHQRTVEHLDSLIEALSTRGFRFSRLGATQLDVDSTGP